MSRERLLRDADLEHFRTLCEEFLDPVMQKAMAQNPAVAERNVKSLVALSRRLGRSIPKKVAQGMGSVADNMQLTRIRQFPPKPRVRVRTAKPKR